MGFSTTFSPFLSFVNEKVNFEKKISEMGNQIRVQCESVRLKCCD